MNAAEMTAKQIGPQAFAMMGAKNIGHSDDGRTLMWKVGGNAKKVTHISVELCADDTYTVTFHKIARNYSSWTKNEVGMVYADGLRQVIESNTGLYLSL